MSSIRRPRRSLLFCPGTERRKIDKASQLSPDGVIIALEDAAALSMKVEARECTARALRELDFGQSERLVRVNPRTSGLMADDLAVTGVAGSLPDTFVLPKVECAADITAAADLLGPLETASGVAQGTTRLIAIIESALGVVNLREIATAHPRLVALIFGAEDLCGDIGATRSPAGDEVAYARSAVVIHAAAADLQVIDTPFVDLHDEAGLVAETVKAMGMGYTGKLAIHPKQVGPITDVFTPTPQEIEAAQELVAAHESHQKAGRGVFALDGKMVDMPMVRAALRVLSRAGL